MRRVSIATTLCILASLLVSGPLTTGAPALASLDSPTRTTVQGVFTDFSTGTPLAGACISLYRYNLPNGSTRNHRLARACSDANGAYSLPDIPVGYQHFAYLEAPGYGEQWSGGYADIALNSIFTVSVAPIQTRNISLKRMTAGLSMHVSRQDDSPAPYATVQVVNSAGTAVANMRTDASGDASRTGLPAGDYKIRVSGAGYAVQYYPGKSTLDGGKAVTLTAGSTVSLSEQFLPVDPMPSLPPPSTMHGTVRALDGTPIAGATVTAKAVNWEVDYGSTSTGADGTYTMDVWGGNGRITVSAPGYATVWNVHDPLPLGSVALAGLHDFVLRPGSGTIRGTLSDSVPGPIPANTSLTATAADGWAYSVPYVGYDGTFEIPNVPAGTYALTIAPPGRQTQQIPNVVVRDGEMTTADAQLLDPGRIRVRVVDDVTGQPIAGATVTATGSQSRVKMTDADGYAVLSDYGTSDSVQVSATHKPYHFDPQPQTVHPAPGTVTDVTLRMTPGAMLTVPVRNVDPAYSICIYLFHPNPSGRWELECEMPTNGVVTYGPLPADTYRAFLQPTNSKVTGAQWVSDSGGSGEERSATLLRLSAGSTTAAPEQHLGPAGSITGRAIDPKTHEIVQGCVQIVASSGAFVAPGSCTNGGNYRIDGLGPYAWPLFFEAENFHGSTWSGGATSRLNAKLLPVTGGQTAYYDFAPGSPAYFDVQGPADAQALSVSVYAYDAQTGDRAGSQWASSSYSNIGPGPKLLLIGYTDLGGTRRTCWMNRPARLRSEQPNGIYYGGSWEHQTPITVVPGKTCLNTMPPIVRITPAPGNMKPLFPGQPPAPRQAVSVTGRSGVAGSPSVAATEPETFNELVQNSFDSALQLAIGALP
jgi:Carboxypeptidase regulatory-like domain